MQLTDYHAKYFAHELTRRCPLGKRRAESEQCCINLMGIQVNLRIDQCTGQLLNTVYRAATSEFMGEVFGVVIG